MTTKDKFLWFCIGGNVTWLIDMLTSPAPLVGLDRFFAWLIAGTLLVDVIQWGTKKWIARRA